MARDKRHDLADKLSAEQPQGWRNQVSAPQEMRPSKQAGRYVRKTFLVTPELEDRIRDLADTERVGLNELVRYLLDYSLEAIESGQHKLPAQPVPMRTLGV